MGERLSPRGVFDTHAHYTDERFAAEFEGGADAAIRECFADGMAGIVNVGTNIENSRRAVMQAKNYPLMYAAVGIHPSDIGMSGGFDEEMSALSALLSGREEDGIVALGEIGLDYHWQPYDKELQAKYLDAQLSLAREMDIPVIIHDREAHGDSLRIVCDYPQLRGVFHCYSGSVEMARELLALGWYLGFDGPVTYKNARKTVEVAEMVPLDRILIETDSPYMSPVPLRGKRNDSRNVFYMAEKLAQIRGMTTQEMADITLENGKRLFGIQ